MAVTVGHDSAKTRQTLTAGGKTVAYYSIPAAQAAGLGDFSNLPAALKVVLENMLRIGRRAIVSFPNFGHWAVRTRLVFGGRMPVTENLPVSWYETPNIHFCTIRDFVDLVGVIDARIERGVALNAGGGQMKFNLPWWVWNLFGEQAVFVLSRR